MKNRILAIIVAAIFYAAFGGFVHGNLLSGIYSKTADLWRSSEDMNVLYANIYCAIYATLFVLFYDFVVKSKSFANGIKFGAFFGVISGFAMAGAWLYMPISLQLAAIWFALGFVESVILGVIVGKILK